MNSKDTRTEKQVAQTRRNFLRMGALGAAAVVAAGVLPHGQAMAQNTRSARKAAGVRSGGTAGTATGGKATRSARKMRSKGEIGAKAESKGGATRSSRKMSTSASQRSAKATKSASNNRSASTRKSGERAASRMTKAVKKAKA